MSSVVNEKILEDNGNLEFTLIEDEPIIGFNQWGEKRLCLPQLLRFVLPDFDIDLIDQAVTDLQIICFQCNSDQINLLHVNNIVPKKIIRCGLIRKSDAERLCKYLLQQNTNLDKSVDAKLFIHHKSIEVVHTCFGEQRGILYPALYSSSDAKCIKCLTCENIFKTFEFVGHTHKLEEVSNTFHWGFDSNNWRLLLQIYAENESTNISGLNKAKYVLDKVKTKFYEEELKKIVSMNKSFANIVWRPSRKLKFTNPPKQISYSLKPAHLKEGPAEFYQKSSNRDLNNLRSEDSSGYVPNVYLDPQDNIAGTESSIDDDDAEDYEEIIEKSLKNFDEVAMNVALQIKREAMPKDAISLGTISTFLNKKVGTPLITQSVPKPVKANYSPVVVAQAHTSVPPQFLMLEALWSQLFRDIIQLTHLVQFNSNDERNRLVGQLIRCQDLFKSQWTNLAQENQSLKENLAQEQSQRRDMEIIRDKMAISLKELTIEKENLAEIVKQLESKCARIRSEMENSTDSNNTSVCCEEEYPQMKRELDIPIATENKIFAQYRMKFKRRCDYDGVAMDNADRDEDTVPMISRKQIRLDSMNIGNEDSSDDSSS